MNRGLTLEQAMQGVQPEPLTRSEWEIMHHAAAAVPDCRHHWSPWIQHGTGRVRHCRRCKLTAAEPTP